MYEKLEAFVLGSEKSRSDSERPSIPSQHWLIFGSLVHLVKWTKPDKKWDVIRSSSHAGSKTPFDSSSSTPLLDCSEEGI